MKLTNQTRLVEGGMLEQSGRIYRELRWPTMFDIDVEPTMRFQKHMGAPEYTGQYRSSANPANNERWVTIQINYE